VFWEPPALMIELVKAGVMGLQLQQALLVSG
jgi:hypothetical protein